MLLMEMQEDSFVLQIVLQIVGRYWKCTSGVVRCCAMQRGDVAVCKWSDDFPFQAEYKSLIATLGAEERKKHGRTGRGVRGVTVTPLKILSDLNIVILNSELKKKLDFLSFV